MEQGKSLPLGNGMWHPGHQRGGAQEVGSAATCCIEVSRPQAGCGCHPSDGRPSWGMG